MCYRHVRVGKDTDANMPFYDVKKYCANDILLHREAGGSVKEACC